MARRTKPPAHSNQKEKREDITFGGKFWQFDLEGKEDQYLAGFILGRMHDCGLNFPDFCRMVGGEGFQEQLNNVMLYQPDDETPDFGFPAYSIDKNVVSKMSRVLGLSKKQTEHLQRLATCQATISDGRIVRFSAAMRDAEFDDSHPPAMHQLNQPHLANTTEKFRKRNEARGMFYRALAEATENKITTPEQLAEAMNLRLEVAEGQRLPRRLEMQMVKPLQGFQPSEDVDFAQLLNAFLFHTVPPPPVSQNEYSANQLRLHPSLVGERFAGNTHVITEEFKQLQRQLMDKEITDGKTPEEAEAFVSKTWVGMRKPIDDGPACLHVTPDGLLLYKAMVFGKDGRLEFDAPAQGEYSANQLILNHSLVGERFEGNTHVITKEFKQLQRQLMDKEITDGKTPEEAEAFVSKTWIGMRKPKTVPACLHVTPDGLLLYKAMVFGKDGRLEFDAPAQGEYSADHLRLHHSLVGERFVCGTHVITEEFKQLQRQLMDREITDGKTPEEAEVFVSKTWIGMRKPKTGPACLHVTPDGLLLYKAMVFGKDGRLEFDAPSQAEYPTHQLSKQPEFNQLPPLKAGG